MTANFDSISFVNQIILEALEKKASDIHFIPRLKEVSIQFRIDGVLSESTRIDKEVLAEISSRIKYLSKLDVAERRLPQSGTFQIEKNDEKIDFRVSIVPCITGEKITVRILHKEAVMFNLDKIMTNPEQLEIAKKMINNPWGMILVTGGTGSGKTTTCYSFIKEYLDKDVHIATIESPVEYILEGTAQIQVNEDIGLTFENSIQNALRMDPDVLFVGEYRDYNSVNMSLKAAQCGHVVLGQFHCKDPREMLLFLSRNENIDTGLAANVVNGIISQILMRKLCDCKKKVDCTDSEKKKYNVKQHYIAVGCEKCMNSGYRGRFPLYDILQLDHEIKEALTDRNEKRICKLVKPDFFKQAIEKVQEGKTTLAEIERSFPQ